MFFVQITRILPKYYLEALKHIRKVSYSIHTYSTATANHEVAFPF